LSRPNKCISFVPTQLPDQTLYSWVTMFHRLSGNASNDLTRVQLFGSEKAGRHFHIPSHLATFCARTHLVLGAPEQLIAKTTVIPFFTRFRPTTVIRDTLAMLKGENAAGVPQMLSMGKIGPCQPLACRYCLECAHEEMLELNFSYWHRAHQLPGALVCHKHATPLIISPLQIGHRFLTRFIEPELGLISISPERCSNEIKATRATLLRLAILAKDIADCAFADGYDQPRLRRTFKKALNMKFSVGRTGGHDPLKLSSAYSDHFHDVQTVPEIQVIFNQRGVHALWCLLESIECRAHPLEWMLIIDWLFGSWDAFRICFLGTEYN